MADIRQLLRRQADWQKAQALLSWPEKIRMVEAMQEALRQFRAMSSGRARRPAAMPVHKPAQDKEQP
jgi:hypothetical protein